MAHVKAQPSEFMVQLVEGPEQFVRSLRSDVGSDMVVAVEQQRPETVKLAAPGVLVGWGPGPPVRPKCSPR